MFEKKYGDIVLKDNSSVQNAKSAEHTFGISDTVVHPFDNIMRLQIIVFFGWKHQSSKL